MKTNPMKINRTTGPNKGQRRCDPIPGAKRFCLRCWRDEP